MLMHNCFDISNKDFEVQIKVITAMMQECIELNNEDLLHFYAESIAENFNYLPTHLIDYLKELKAEYIEDNNIQLACSIFLQYLK